MASSLSAWDHLVKVATQFNISTGGFSLSGIRFRPIGGDPAGCGIIPTPIDDMVASFTEGWRVRSGSRVAMSGWAGDEGEVGAVLLSHIMAISLPQSNSKLSSSRLVSPVSEGE